tara:strand:- start:309 stop:878 length:570 start_codon:yes stop_codon:yes gene_type:complete
MSDKMIDEHFENHFKTITGLNAHKDSINSITQEIIKCFKNDGKLFICGNGGSASDAQHIAAELIGRYLKERIPLPAISLSTDTSILTAVSNDYGYEEVFSRQISALTSKNDIVMVLSTSGDSRNIAKAIEAAKKNQSLTIGLFGGNNGSLENSVDYSIKVPSKITAHIQEAHIVIGHIICSLLDLEYAK